ncbi:hypothetical protein [Methanogenium sp. MK-MG]|uniref:hypothetical protein n=1 Tax=Methanogenium sp. MK-MG TaxID=2599926 RepID=UPI0013EB6222|nr:hypothetical protein [Methanogenium sp. MK-MG]
MSNSFIKQKSTHYYYMKFRGIISVIFFTVLITCAGTAAAAGGAESGVLFSLEPVTGVEDEYILSCDGADGGPAGVFGTFPGPVSIVSTTLPGSHYRLNGTTLACALIDEGSCSLHIRCADLQAGTLSLSWEMFTDGLSGEAGISVSDTGVVSVLSPGETSTGSVGNPSSTPVQQSPFACTLFTVMVSLAAAGAYAGGRGGDSR